MSAPDGFAAWQRLVSRVVDDVDPAWISGADASLLGELRATRRGRRWLARHLARDSAKALMSLRGIDAMPVLPDCDWIFESGATLRSRIADLGTLALAPGLRKLVDRHAVRCLRERLTPGRYAWLMACDPDIDSGITDVRQLKGWRLVDRALADDDAFAGLIEQRGLHEIGSALNGAPKLLRERIMLIYPPGARDGAPDGWLPPGR
ncbi:MAG: hypothetical protein AAFU65_08240, partial [Pseudomonadota bacterium]